MLVYSPKLRRPPGDWDAVDVEGEWSDVEELHGEAFVNMAKRDGETSEKVLAAAGLARLAVVRRVVAVSARSIRAGWGGWAGDDYFNSPMYAALRLGLPLVYIDAHFPEGAADLTRRRPTILVAIYGEGPSQSSVHRRYEMVIPMRLPPGATDEHVAKVMNYVASKLKRFVLAIGADLYARDPTGNHLVTDSGYAYLGQLARRFAHSVFIECFTQRSFRAVESFLMGYMGRVATGSKPHAETSKDFDEAFDALYATFKRRMNKVLSENSALATIGARQGGSSPVD